MEWQKGVTVWLVFPNQLFESIPDWVVNVAIVEEELYFTQFAFHKQKLILHRASMKRYAEHLKDQGKRVRYFECCGAALSIFTLLAQWVVSYGIEKVVLYNPEDNWISRRLVSASQAESIQIDYLESPQFILSVIDLDTYFKGKLHFLQANFYSAQRKRFQVLVDGGKPLGGKWSFDEDNRERFPKNRPVPRLSKDRTEEEGTYWSEAVNYVESHFPEAPGVAQGDFYYAISHEGAQLWLKDFVENRLLGFGTYEDALVTKEPLLHHSLLSVYLNNGLLLPRDVLGVVLKESADRDLPLNDVEGFVRQLLGWREFIRGVYLVAGNEQRTLNYWGYTRKIPQSFYDGTTGITPVDVVIKKVLKNGYCHHIERLMVLSNFMLLCDFDPDEVYRWFMELFMDAYDWVMVPNVYGMGQFADGGMMSTKPYISGSNYLIKMGDFERGAWTEVWDALYWRFIDVHRDFFLKNPRMGIMVNAHDKMDLNKKERLSLAASNFFVGLNDE